MVLLLLAIVLGTAALIWLWKGPIQKIVEAMKKNGSSTVEAYAVIVILTVGTAATGYLIFQIL